MASDVLPLDLGEYYTLRMETMFLHAYALESYRLIPYERRCASSDREFVPRFLGPRGFLGCASFGTKLLFRGVRCKSRNLSDRDWSRTEVDVGRD